MHKNTQLALARREWLLTALALGASALPGCGLLPSGQTEDKPAQATQELPDDEKEMADTDNWVSPERASQAITPRAYRRDAASYLYTLNSGRIYKGKLPPLLYAVGVLDVTVDRLGCVQATCWARAPQHAPEVMAEIVRTVYQASPLPAPVHMGGVVYTDTWLWHKSGKFQLDTLCEGQS